MQWSMPPRVLQIVAGLIGSVAVAAFVMGVVNAPTRGRLPGEKADADGTVAPLEATDATPLSQERIEGPPPPTPLTEAQKAKLEAEKLAKAEAEAAAKLAAATPTGQTPTAPLSPAGPAPDRVGDILQNAMPPQEEPPH